MSDTFKVMFVLNLTFKHPSECNLHSVFSVVVHTRLSVKQHLSGFSLNWVKASTVKV